MKFYNREVECLTIEYISNSFWFAWGATLMRMVYCDDWSWIIIGAPISFFVALLSQMSGHYIMERLGKELE